MYRYLSFIFILTLVSTTQPTYEGHTFQGWATDASATTVQYSPSGFIFLNTDITLYAVWTVNPPSSYKLIYNANGGDNAPSPLFVKANTYTSVSASIPTPPADTGKTFLYWLDTTAGIHYNPGSWIFVNRDIEEEIQTYSTPWVNVPVTSDVLVIAKWKIARIVTFNLNGGQGVIAPMYVGEGGKIVQPVDPERDGYAFVLWSYYDPGRITENGGWFVWDFDTDIVSGDVVLWANWKIAYTMTFNQNGSPDFTGPQYVADGELAIEPVLPIWKGHESILWSWQDPTRLHINGGCFKYELGSVWALFLLLIEFRLVLLSGGFYCFIRNAKVFHILYDLVVISTQLMLYIQHRLRYFLVALGFTLGFTLGFAFGFTVRFYDINNRLL